MVKKSLTAVAQAATAAMFSNASESSQAAQDGRQDVQTDKPSENTKDARKGVKTPQTRRKTNKGKNGDDVKVFSFRSWVDEVESWRLYAQVKGMKVDDLGAAAMREYIKRHPVTDEERQYQEAALLLKSRNQNS